MGPYSQLTLSLVRRGRPHPRPILPLPGRRGASLGTLASSQVPAPLPVPGPLPLGPVASHLGILLTSLVHIFVGAFRTSAAHYAYGMTVHQRIGDLPTGGRQVAPEASSGYSHAIRRLLLRQFLKVDQPDRLQLGVGQLHHLSLRRSPRRLVQGDRGDVLYAPGTPVSASSASHIVANVSNSISNYCSIEQFKLNTFPSAGRRRIFFPRTSGPRDRGR